MNILDISTPTFAILFAAGAGYCLLRALVLLLNYHKPRTSRKAQDSLVVLYSKCFMLFLVCHYLVFVSWACCLIALYVDLDHNSVGAGGFISITSGYCSLFVPAVYGMLRSLMLIHETQNQTTITPPERS